MKKINLIYLFIVTTILVGCSSSDNTQDLSDTPTVSFDVDAIIALTPGQDISSLVSFNGQSAATYTSELELNGILNVGRPEGLLSTDEFEYYDVLIKDIDNNEIEFDETTYISEDGNLKFVVPNGKPSDYYINSDDYTIDVFEIQAINADAQSDIEYKYDLEVMITRNGTEYGPYIIDPKLRIRGRR